MSDQARWAKNDALVAKAAALPHVGRERQCVTKDGKPKRKYLSREEAKRTAKTYVGGHMRAYRCSVCGHFHIGTRPS